MWGGVFSGFLVDILSLSINKETTIKLETVNVTEHTAGDCLISHDKQPP